MSVSDIANPAQPVPHRDKLQWRFNIPSLGRVTRSNADPLSDISVCNRKFISQISHLRMLKRFMLEEKMSFSETDIETMNLGRLNNLRYRVHGRLVTTDEWAALDKLSSAITSHLDTVDLKRKIRIRELGLFFGKLPLLFLCVSVISTAMYLILPDMIPIESDLYGLIQKLIVIVWSLTQGGLGACAFLGTSVVRKSAEDIDKVQNASEQGSKSNEISQQLTDITDRNFLKIRIILGALFGFLIGLPLSHVACRMSHYT
jgi:ABC-type multidrug transport system fused ATPase/permease subunit